MASRVATPWPSASPPRSRVAALALRAVDASPVLIFIVAGVAVAALAYVLGEATEQAGESSSPRLAALLNATFGNAPELIIVILTVNAGLINVAKASIIGSVLGNILLILGLSLIAGGLRHGHLTFAKRPAGVNASMLTLAVVLVALPTAFAQHRAHEHAATRRSSATAPRR